MNKAWYDSHQTVAGQCTDVHWLGQTLVQACYGLFAGVPAPTGTVLPSALALSLWERARPRRGRPG
ncbi:hypothetical protein PPUN110474_41940 [Pseudomonas putida]|nr:hypothetical protein PPUN110474_41940 [Pseudomonas putida]